MVEWKPLRGYELYLISSNGDIKDLMTDRYLVASYQESGPSVLLFSENGYTRCKVADLVLKTFLRLPEKDEILFFFDGNCNNVNISNLSWKKKKEEVVKKKQQIADDYVCAIKCSFYSGSRKISQLADCYDLEIEDIKDILFNPCWNYIDIPGTKIIDNNGKKIPDRKLPELAVFLRKCNKYYKKRKIDKGDIEEGKNEEEEYDDYEKELPEMSLREFRNFIRNKNGDDNEKK